MPPLVGEGDGSGATGQHGANYLLIFLADVALVFRFVDNIGTRIAGAAMPLYEPIVHVRYMRPLLAWAEEITPGTAARLLRELDFSHLLRDQSDSVLTLAQCDALLSAVT